MSPDWQLTVQPAGLSCMMHASVRQKNKVEDTDLHIAKRIMHTRGGYSSVSAPMTNMIMNQG